LGYYVEDIDGDEEVPLAYPAPAQFAAQSSSPRVPWEPSVPAMPPPPPPAKDVAALAAAAASAMIAGGGGGAAQRGGGAAGASSAAPPVGAPPPSDVCLLSVTVPYGCVPGQTLQLSTPAGAKMHVIVPPGCGPGSVFNVRPPLRTPSAPPAL